MLRPLLSAVAAALAVSCVSQVIAASPRYTMTQLRAISVATGTYANVSDINNNGLAVGEETRYATGAVGQILVSASRGLVWGTGPAAGATMLGAPGTGFVGAAAQQVNDAGQIVGVLYRSDGSRAAATLNGTTATALVPLTDVGRVAGLNAGGDVLATGSSGPVLLRANTATPVNLSGYSGIYVDAVGIADAGAIVGQSMPFTAWAPRPLSLSTTAAPARIVDVNAVALTVNAAGVSAGYAADTSSSREAAIFSGGVVRRLGVLPYSGSATGANGSLALGLNGRGDAVGTSGPAGGAAGEQKAFLYRGGSLIDLSTLVNGGTLPAGFRPNGINDRGQIIGNVYVDHDNNTATARIGIAFRLDPIRVPGDANADGLVNVADLGILATNYGGTGRAFYETGDFNYDWRVDVADLGVLATNYGTPNTLAADLAAFGLTAVPEPASLATLAAAGAMLGRRRRRRRPTGYTRP